MPGEKTEKATPKRRRDERRKGNTFLSNEVVTVASLLVMFYSLRLLGPLIVETLTRSIGEFITLGQQRDPLTAEQVRLCFVKGASAFFIASFPLMIISVLVAIIVTGAQTRFLFASKLLEFKGSRLNPLNGIKRMFSMRGLVELVKSICKVVILGIVIYRVMLDEIPVFPRMMEMDVIQVMVITGSMILQIVKTAAIIFVFLAAGDYAYQWWEYEKNLRMSKEDIKEEYKQTEGDPQVKGKIKERQQAQARRRMMQNVPNADVVIRNPTHYAVAIQYDPEKNSAPVVVAKGADHIALKIVEVAEANHVIVLENRPLARGLYDTVDLEQEIPEKFFKPVAGVLAYVYNLRERERRSH